MRKKNIILYIICMIASFCYIKTDNTKLNILFTTTYFPASHGRFILNLITECIDAGHNVKIYAKYHGPTKKMHPHISTYALINKVHYGSSPPRLENFDIIFAQFGYRGAEMARLIRRIPSHKRPKLVTCFRGADITKFVKRNTHLYDNLFRFGDLFLPVCNYFKKLLIDLGCPPKKIQVLHSSIDCDAFYFNPKPFQYGELFHVISVSRLVEKKGVKYTIKAIKKAIEEYPLIHYTIIGDGPDYEKLRILVKQLALQNYVTFTGKLSEKEIIPRLHSSHLFILPSITAKNGDKEGIPNALKEAMACGLPVIATNHAGNAELVIPETGFLVDEKSSTHIAQKILFFIRNSDYYKDRVEIGRSHVVKEFNIDVVGKKLLELLANVKKKKTKQKSEKTTAHHNFYRIASARKYSARKRV